MQHKKAEYVEGIEHYINEYREENYGISPTVQEIANAVGLVPGTVSKYMTYMREQGIISYEGHRSVVTKQSKRASGGDCRVPILGSVSCGLLKFAEENIEEYVKLPVSICGQGEFFLLHANGDSMINAGISDGDLVLVRQQNTADYNQIVVALVEDEATLKRFRPDGEIIRLHAENPAYDDILTEHCVIQGIAVKVIKDLI